jgi:hypothetical protein
MELAGIFADHVVSSSLFLGEYLYPSVIKPSLHT